MINILPYIYEHISVNKWRYFTTKLFVPTFYNFAVTRKKKKNQNRGTKIGSIVAYIL